MTRPLKAPQVRHYIERLGRVKYRQFDCSFTYDSRSYELLDELFELLSQIETTGKNKAWAFWLTEDRGSIEDFGDYNEWLEAGEVNSYVEFEEQWKNEYPDEQEWFYFQAVYEEDIDYRAVFLHHEFVIEQDPRKERSYENDISEFIQWLVDGVKEVIADLNAGIYNTRVQQELPYQHRTGTVLRRYEWEIYPKQREDIIGNMTDEDIEYFLTNATSKVSNDFRLATVTANDFYRYCAMGYKACDYSETENLLKSNTIAMLMVAMKVYEILTQTAQKNLSNGLATMPALVVILGKSVEVVIRHTLICLSAEIKKDGISRWLVQHGLAVPKLRNFSSRSTVLVSLYAFIKQNC